MKTIRLLLAIGVLATVLAGCADEPKQAGRADINADLDVAMPTIKPGYGRIYFLRSSAFIGYTVQPEIQLNNEVVGRSRPNGFFFVDRPAGPYQARTSTSVATVLNFDLYPGEVKYVRTDVTIANFGVMPGSVSLILMDESVAAAELRKLGYASKINKPEDK